MKKLLVITTLTLAGCVATPQYTQREVVECQATYNSTALLGDFILPITHVGIDLRGKKFAEVGNHSAVKFKGKQVDIHHFTKLECKFLPDWFLD